MPHTAERVAARAAAKVPNDRMLEWFSSGVMLVWSVMLGFSGDLFALPPYIEFRRYGLTETAWACIFGMFGAARIVALVINGRWPSGPWIRMIGALFGATVWTQICVMLTQGASLSYHAFGTGTGVYALIALADLFSVQQAARDARYFTG